MKSRLWVLGAALAGPAVLAQDALAVTTDEALLPLPGAGYFFAAIVAGVLLAIAFQLILTNLSVAAGLGALDDLLRSGRSRDERRYDQRDYHGRERESTSDRVYDALHTATRGFGVWTLVTASVSLFFAAWLAGEVSLTPDAGIGVIVGLTVWALFYVAMMTMEVNAASSLVGSLGRLATGGLRSAYDTTKSIFSPSTETKAADTAREVTRAVYRELSHDVDTKKLRGEIQKYVHQLEPPNLDARTLRKEFEKLLDHSELHAVMTETGPLHDREEIVATLQRERGMSKEDAEKAAGKVDEAFTILKEELNSDKAKSEQISDAAARMTGKSPEEAREAREKLENYLRNTGKEELNPDSIKQELETLLRDPRTGRQQIAERLAKVDKSTFVALLSEREDVSEEEAQNIVDQVSGVIDNLTGGDGGHGQPASGGPGGPNVPTRTTHHSGVTGKVRDYLNSLDDPALRYEGIRHDVSLLFHDPEAGYDALKQRLSAMDRDTLKSIVASRRDISDEDAERIVTSLEGARDDAIARAEKVRDEVARRLDHMKDEAIHQADEARKVAAEAAWWACGTGVASGISAIAGGALAAATRFVVVMAGGG